MADGSQLSYILWMLPILASCHTQCHWGRVVWCKVIQEPVMWAGVALCWWSQWSTHHLCMLTWYTICTWSTHRLCTLPWYTRCTRPYCSEFGSMVWTGFWGTMLKEALLSAEQALADLLACMMMQVNQDGGIGPLPDWEHFPDFPAAKVLGTKSATLPDLLTSWPILCWLFWFDLTPLHLLT
jgi:hypothetical protein